MRRDDVDAAVEIVLGCGAAAEEDMDRRRDKFAIVLFSCILSCRRIRFNLDGLKYNVSKQTDQALFFHCSAL